ncbi:hypothetical protein FALCPG4_015182 [Fusarium falciforme]
MTDSDLDEKPSMPPDQYTIGWISALSEELAAARVMLDQEHEGLPDQPSNDDNSYVLGSIKQHNIVMPVLPDYGISSATSAVKSMQSTFPNLRFILMVGIGGGIPSKQNDIRLGDVAVSEPDGQGGGVIQYDLGREEKHQFLRVGLMNRPPKQLLSTIRKLRSELGLGATLSKIVKKAVEKREDPEDWIYPGTDQDMLFTADYPHLGDNDCEQCFANAKPENLVNRRPRKQIHPRIHYGNIGSGNTVMKNALKRDEIAKKENIICFEMEAAGLMNEVPCLVIRGISDYADSHKSGDWKQYAAVVATAYARRLLLEISPQGVEKLEPLREVVQEIKTNTVQTSRDVNELVRAQRDSYDDSILQWLTTVDYAPQHNDFIRRRQPGTGQWFLDSDEFQAWLKTDKATLFCPGNPGAGKTFMTAIVVDHLHSKFGDDPNVCIAYIYCNFKRQDEQKADDMLASLLKQLARRQPSLPGAVQKLCDRHWKNQFRPSFDGISESLHSVASTYSRVFIVVDALDECEDDCRVKLLLEIFQLQRRFTVNLCATSRPLSEITSMFDEALCLDIRATKDDVGLYLENHIGTLRSAVKASLQLQTQIKMGISDAVDGMFLLAHIYLQFLKDKVTENDVQSALERIQNQKQASGGDKGKLLSGAYDKAIERINEQELGLRELAIQVLSWITCAKRQLTTTELQHALATKKGNRMLDTRDLVPIKDIVSVCAGLVTVDKESDVIRLAHYTTQQYLNDRRKDLFQNVESQIVTTCITYLSFDVFESGFCRTDVEFEERMRANPFYDYAAHNWGHHAREAMIPSQVVIGFLESQTKVEASSQALIAIKRYSSQSEYSQKIPRQMTGLHLAAYFGVKNAAQVLLSSSDPDSKDSYGWTPLCWAVWKGHEVVVQLLLNNGAKVDAMVDGRPTPLVLAAERRHEAIVKLLLEKGAHTESKNENGQTPLSLAAENGDQAIVKLLLDNGADTKSRDEQGQTPLCWAVEKEHEAAVQLLLNNNANVDAKGDDDWLPLRTPLTLAAQNGHESIIKLLLDKGASVNAEDSYGWTPLILAAENGLEAIVQLLLNKGAVIESKDEDGRTPLWHAAANGHKAIVQMLLDKGADVESEDTVGWTPLSYTDHVGHEAIFQLLLASNATGFYNGQTSLSDAAEYGYEAVVHQLLEKGAETESKDRNGRTPLSIAAANGDQAIVKLLLDKGADIESEDILGQTPLGLAIKEGHEAIVQLLLEKGADTESRGIGILGGTPLGLAIEEGHEAIVQLLLEKGANTESRDEEGQTPLSWAVEGGHEAIVQLLLDKGADVESEDILGRTPLWHAAAKGEKAIINLLLENGAGADAMILPE